MVQQCTTHGQTVWAPANSPAWRRTSLRWTVKTRKTPSTPTIRAEWALELTARWGQVWEKNSTSSSPHRMMPMAMADSSQPPFVTQCPCRTGPMRRIVTFATRSARLRYTCWEHIAVVSLSAWGWTDIWSMLAPSAARLCFERRGRSLELSRPCFAMQGVTCGCQQVRTQHLNLNISKQRTATSNTFWCCQTSLAHFTMRSRANLLDWQRRLSEILKSDDWREKVQGIIDEGQDLVTMRKALRHAPWLKSWVLPEWLMSFVGHSFCGKNHPQRIFGSFWFTVWSCENMGTLRGAGHGQTTWQATSRRQQISRSQVAPPTWTVCTTSMGGCCVECQVSCRRYHWMSFASC